MRFAIVESPGGLATATLVAALQSLEVTATDTAPHASPAPDVEISQWTADTVTALTDARGDAPSASERAGIATLVTALRGCGIDSVALSPLNIALLSRGATDVVLALVQRFALLVAPQSVNGPGAAIEEVALAVLAVRRQPLDRPFRVLGYTMHSNVHITLAETDDLPSAAAGNRDELLVLATNIDDMGPQHYDILVERLFAAGALDVWLESIAMKKGRPGTMLSALARPADRDRLIDLLIEQSTTLGVRIAAVERISAERRFESVTTRWGEVRIKLKVWRGRVLDAAPEYADCAAIARAHDIGIRTVTAEAVNLGQVYIGRRVDRTPDVRLLGADEFPP